MSVHNTRQKGRRFVVKYLLPELLKIDTTAHETVGSGQGNHEKSDLVCSLIGVAIEGKNVPSGVAAEGWLHEAQKDADNMHMKGVLAWRCPQSPEERPTIHAALDFFWLVELLRKDREVPTGEGREMRFHLTRAIDHLKKAVKSETL